MVEPRRKKNTKITFSRAGLEEKQNKTKGKGRFGIVHIYISFYIGLICSPPSKKLAAQCPTKKNNFVSG